MNRDEAAVLLGVPVTADPEEVRHAWRMWARIAHPDADGDPAHFTELEQARRVLLQAAPAVASVVVPRTTAIMVKHCPQAGAFMRVGSLGGRNDSACSIGWLVAFAVRDCCGNVVSCRGSMDRLGRL